MPNAMLDEIYKGSAGGTSYWQGILSFLQSSNTGSRVQCVQYFVRNVAPSLPKVAIGGLINSRMRELLAIQLDTEFSSQVVGRINLLAAEVITLDETHKATIDEIDHADLTILEKFHQINNLLPFSKKWRLCPLSPVTDSFMTFSEEVCLFITLVTLYSLKGH